MKERESFAVSYSSDFVALETLTAAYSSRQRVKIAPILFNTSMGKSISGSSVYCIADLTFPFLTAPSRGSVRPSLTKIAATSASLYPYAHTEALLPRAIHYAAHGGRKKENCG
ncbi:hypothetical protein E2C01_060592 [Portunus trituberculatus]|uniref:Uncharacterized protein n=1 Tax=Portunus trituberculatus TaxID=210409 RepID=A0A5B7H9W3_PORTR|nr:hypothetical protein [Portunus trituberculatus]